MGARGNSGVILSQLVAGALREAPVEGQVDAAALARILRGASDAGYAAVRNPQEGTILTVARALAERAEALAGRSAGRGGVGRPARGRRGRLAATTDQLDVLKQAGVVDAGGAGLLEIIRGIASCVRGEELPELAPLLESIPFAAVHQELSQFRYCTSFFVEGDKSIPDEPRSSWRSSATPCSSWAGRGAVKAHLHTDEPGTVLNSPPPSG